ncbi:B-cell receptor CD22-like [Cololabis saira]|uniref:B-cell receptor CD22-like n=1 Tax=Cololabis saira TaxID=129043 RepID=UPI002AD4F816|nr:B-cell receptor CD22-like [Cololabis saira]
MSEVISDVFCVTAVCGQHDWSVNYTSTQICALKGSTVDIDCTFTYPLTINETKTVTEKTLWFTKTINGGLVDLMTDSDYRGRVMYNCNERNCSLRITGLKERDSAVYKFSFITNQPGGSFTGSPGVTLSVTDLKVEVRRSSSLTELRCKSSCDEIDPPSYVWYNNGQKMEEEASSCRVAVRNEDSFSCAVKGREDHRSPSVYAPSPPSVSVNPSGEIVEGTSVTLTCSSDANPAATYSWYRRNVRTPVSEEQTLVFTSIQSSESGEYYCTSENELGMRTSEPINIDVKYAPQPPSVSVNPSGEIVEGTSVTLTCSSDANPAATHSWYRRNVHTPVSEEQTLVFTSIQSSESGEYYCTSGNELGMRMSEPINIDVKYAPQPPSVSVNPSSEIVEGTSVTLTCSSDANPAATYSWYRRNVSTAVSEEQTLVFTSIQSSESGEYYCTSENELGMRTSEPINIDVKYAPKPPSVSVNPSGEIVEGTSVTLACSSDANPAATHSWYRRNVHTPVSEKRTLVFTSIQSSESGEYYCTSGNELGMRMSGPINIDVKYLPKPPSVSVNPSGEIVEGTSVTLTCSSDANPAATHSWYRRNVSTAVSEEQTLVFTSIQSSESGEYYCTSENELGMRMSEPINIDVKCE